jgi:hypothetical protein
MKQLFAVTLLAIVLAGASTALAAYMPGRAVESPIQRVEPGGRVVTLTDGTMLTMSPRLSSEPLHAGQVVTFWYHQMPNGKKEVAAFWIDAGRDGRVG